MDVNYVVSTFSENFLQLSLEADAYRHPCLRSVCIYGLASSNSDYVGLGCPTLDVRGDYVDMVPESSSFTREEMNVLDDPAEVGIVILGDDSNPKGTRSLRNDVRM